MTWRDVWGLGPKIWRWEGLIPWEARTPLGVPEEIIESSKGLNHHAAGRVLLLSEGVLEGPPGITEGQSSSCQLPGVWSTPALPRPRWLHGPPGAAAVGPYLHLPCAGTAASRLGGAGDRAPIQA